MKRKRTKLSAKTIVLTVAAILLLGAGTVLGAVGLPTTESEQIETSFGMADTAVAIVENGNTLEAEDGVAALGLDNFDKDSQGNIMIKPGKRYAETVAAKNESEHDQYVRLIVRKYWAGAEGKDPALTPDMIELDTGSAWEKSTEESKKETEVFYYTEKLAAGSVSAPAIKGVRVSGDVLDAVDVQTEENTDGYRTVYTYTYSFDGCRMVIEAEMQAVQTHNADEAIVSVWGNDAPLPGGDGTLHAE